MREQPLAIRLFSDPALTEMARLVGYQGIPYPLGKEDYERLLAKSGKDRLIKAADELFDYDREKKLTKLKDNVRNLCWGMLGPPPEQWDAFYAGITNPPPNPYKVAAAEKPAAPPPVEESPAASSEIDLLRASHGWDLRRLLLTEHAHLRDYPPGHHVRDEAIRRMDLLEGEMRRRGNKVPPRPTASPSVPAREQRVRDLDGAELMRRLSKARDVLASESEHWTSPRMASAQIRA